jgi:hypothetical protein
MEQCRDAERPDFITLHIRVREIFDLTLDIQIETSYTSKKTN